MLSARPHSRLPLTRSAFPGNHCPFSAELPSQWKENNGANGGLKGWLLPMATILNKLSGTGWLISICISLQHPSRCSGWHGVPRRCVAQPPATPGPADLWLLIRARLSSSALWSVTLLVNTLPRRGTCPVPPVWRAGLRRCVRSLLIGCCRLGYIETTRILKVWCHLSTVQPSWRPAACPLRWYSRGCRGSTELV